MALISVHTTVAWADTSRCWPSPEDARSQSATTMSAAACAPAWNAAWGIAPMGRGGRSGLPCSPTRPPAASTVSSAAGMPAAGPLVPNGVTEACTTCGKRSAMPAVRPDSTNTSASARNAVGSSATTLRLPAPRAAQ